MTKYLLTLLLFSIICLRNSTYALTSPYVKEQQLGIDLYLESANLDYTPPTRFQPVSLDTASEDPYHWIYNVLPYEEDRYEDMYLVIPQLGLVTPIVDIPVGTNDYELMKNGKQIEINNYLKGGIIEYVSSVSPGHRGKRVDFGHSNYYKSDNGRYKSIFANLMALDVNDQVRYYVRQPDGNYKLFKYLVTASYNTYPSNVQALQWDGDGADALIFGCTHGLDGRWMIEATYVGDALGSPLGSIYEEQIPAYIKQALDRALAKLRIMPDRWRKFKVIQLFKLVEQLKGVTRNQELRELVLEYLEIQLADMYPES